MKPSRMTVYIIIALLVAGLAFYYLTQEPPLGSPINLIYMLFRH
jgi:hypothetical protein